MIAFFSQLQTYLLDRFKSRETIFLHHSSSHALYLMHFISFLFLQIHWKFKCPKVRAKTFRQIKYMPASVYLIHFASFRLFSICLYIFLCKITHECIQFLLTLFSMHSFGLYANSLRMCKCTVRERAHKPSVICVNM